MSLENSTASENYKALTGAVLPRPLLWILTENEAGCHVAPYSFVNIVSTEPPLVSIAFGRRKNETELKGTLKALKETGKAVLHITTQENIDDIYESATKKSFKLDDAVLVRDVDEFPPRINNCPIALFCEFHDIIDINHANTHLVICTVKHIYKKEDTPLEKLKPLTCIGESGIITLNNKE
tara:strand:+ start:101471 stop:102013 length:543 start_codon:yes stop_codon:yes gene_type:complete